MPKNVVWSTAGPEDLCEQPTIECKCNTESLGIQYCRGFNIILSILGKDNLESLPLSATTQEGKNKPLCFFLTLTPPSKQRKTCSIEGIGFECDLGIISSFDKEKGSGKKDCVLELRRAEQSSTWVLLNLCILWKKRISGFLGRKGMWIWAHSCGAGRTVGWMSEWLWGLVTEWHGKGPCELVGKGWSLS